MNEDELSDADLWEAKVQSGMPKDSATAYVRNRGTPTSEFGTENNGAGGSWGAGSTSPMPGVDLRASRAAEQGLTLGWADEMRAALAGAGAAIPGGESPRGAFDRTLNRERADLSDYHRENPIAATGAEIAGGLVTGGIGGARAAGASIGRRVASSPVVQGAVIGGVSGAGFAEGDKVAGAGTGTVLGGAFGGLIQALSGVRGAGARAKNKLVGALQRGGVDDIERVAAEAGPGETLLEVGGQNVRKLGRAAESIPSEGSEQIRTALVERASGAPGRITGALQRETGLAFEDGAETLADMAAQRRAKAGPLYEAAFSRGAVDDPEIVKLLQSKPSLRAAYDRARATAAEEGAELAPFESPDVRTLHMVKEELDDLIRRARRSADQSSPSARNTRAMVQTKEALLERLDAAVPEYGAARQQFAGDAALEDAFEAAGSGDRERGLRAFLTEDPNKVKQALGRMSESEQDFYRRGALDSVRQRLEKSADERDLSKVVFGSPEMRARVRVLFNSEDEFSRFEQAMTRERGMADTGQFVLGGSPTSRIDAERADLTGPAWKLSDVLHPFRTGERLLDAGVTRAQAGGGEATVNRLAPMLTASDDKLTELTQMLKEFQEKEAQRRALTAGGARVGGFGLGRFSGRASE